MAKLSLVKTDEIEELGVDSDSLIRIRRHLKQAMQLVPRGEGKDVALYGYLDMALGKTSEVHRDVLRKLEGLGVVVDQNDNYGHVVAPQGSGIWKQREDTLWYRIRSGPFSCGEQMGGS